MVSVLCKGLSFVQFDTVGKCFTEVVFFGDALFASIMVLFLFAFIGIKAGLPLEVMFPGGLGIVFCLWLLSGSSLLLGLFLIGLILGGLIFGIKFLESLNRG